MAFRRLKQEIYGSVKRRDEDNARFPGEKGNGREDHFRISCQVKESPKE
ncbi:MAG: hypothetical protein KatS3mg105_3352 [Gemmatales bacterium]|nr:MAG: hypothetical protein KatS3mg105_3352 [Gemmatales bacterium]